MIAPGRSKSTSVIHVNFDPDSPAASSVIQPRRPAAQASPQRPPTTRYRVAARGPRVLMLIGTCPVGSHQACAEGDEHEHPHAIAIRLLAEQDCSSEAPFLHWRRRRS
jgi:hypothetical protein